ncbi:MAG: DUF4263 domain-containing protein [Bacteroidota bacterium]|nr:DUF4263 domain-containing protein [Bacteroidota bacterium]MDP4234311.1 DUF4263 domain-containing protein [Bacteroidota bacterium]MDP4243245.1 DUF4263 domain-containing protein [Bacteroidota bacterium]MDP4288048.1 DUF4263 domain-containing protein [Bacteroidota bacterium]
MIPEIEAIHSELPSEDAGEDTIKEAIQVVLNEKNRKSYVLTLYLQSEGVKRAIAEQDASLAAFHMAHAMAARAMIIFIEKLHRPIWQGYSFGYSERFLSDLRRDLTAGHSEEHWQKKLTDNPFLLTLLFAHPVVVVAQKAYVGGKTVENRDGMIVDYLVKNALTGGSALIEIKRPNTPLLGSEYRNGVYSIHAEVSGAVNQVLTYRNQLILEYSSITMNNGEADAEQYEAFNPPCIVVAGNVSDELSDSQKRRSFELYRNSLAGVQIIGYDELVKRAQALTGAFKASFPD